MAIMVSSFRTSVAEWLDAVLPADVYARVAAGRDAPLDPALQRLIAAAPGVVRADFLRTIELTLEPQRPAVALLVRDLDPRHPQQQLPMMATGRSNPICQNNGTSITATKRWI
jgi:putative ABC transport system permease protein